MKQNPSVALLAIGAILALGCDAKQNHRRKGPIGNHNKRLREPLAFKQSQIRCRRTTSSHSQSRTGS